MLAQMLLLPVYLWLFVGAEFVQAAISSWCRSVQRSFRPGLGWDLPACGNTDSRTQPEESTLESRRHIEIAIGAGTDVSIASAGAILASDDPRSVLSVLELSRAAYRKMKQNLWWAAGYNLISVPLAAGVLAPIGFVLPMSVGATLMSLSTIVIALNAQLLRRLDLRPETTTPRRPWPMTMMNPKKIMTDVIEPATSCDHSEHGYITYKARYPARLKRIEGQARGVYRMVEDEQYCIDILTQISALTSTRQSTAVGLLEDHLRRCVIDAVRAGGDTAVERTREASLAIGRLIR